MTRPNGHRLKNVILQSTKIVTSFFINKLTIIIIIISMFPGVQCPKGTSTKEDK